MHFDNFTQEEKDYFVEKLGDLITVCNDDKIYIEDKENYDQFALVKYTCHKGTIYLLEIEEDPDGLFEINEGVWMPNSQYVYYEITKEGIEQFVAEREDGFSLIEYTFHCSGK